MTLRELLNILRSAIIRDTSDRVSGDSDQLWSDTVLVSYINEAQRRFAKRSLCIRDAGSPASQFLTVPGQQDYTLSPTVVAVQTIRNLGNGSWKPTGPILPTSGPGMIYVTDPPGAPPIYPDEVDLYRISHEDRRGRRLRHSGDYSMAWDINRINQLGRPRAWESDETSAEINGSAGVTSVRITPIPDVAHGGCLMQMRVARLPLLALTVDDLDAVPEIPEDYHLNMLDYAAYLALRIVDHEAGDPVRAAEFQASFNAHVEEARTEIDRKRFAPMRFAIGGNGFSYTGN